MSVRGYAIDKEAQSLLSFLYGYKVKEGDELDPSPWKFHHSLCWWTVRVLGLEVDGVPHLDDSTDQEELSDLHARLQALLTYPPSPPQHTDNVEGVDRATAAKKAFEDNADLAKIVNKIMTMSGYEENQKQAGKKPVIASNSTVTPAMVGSQPYRSFNSWHAHAVLFDDAAAFHRTDGLITYGDSGRPLFAVGDEKQLPPTLLTMNDKLSDGSAFNRFGENAKTSWLSWLLHLGIPAFHLYKQQLAKQ
ncbi:hypothetical protein ACHAPJ_011253 [Fusarium lateritium]